MRNVHTKQVRGLNKEEKYILLTATLIQMIGHKYSGPGCKIFCLL